MSLTSAKNKCNLFSVCFIYNGGLSMICHFSIVQVHLVFCQLNFIVLFPFLIKYYHIMFIHIVIRVKLWSGWRTPLYFFLLPSLLIGKVWVPVMRFCVCHIHCRVHWRAGRTPGLCRSTSALLLVGSTIREFFIGSALWVSEVLCCL